MRSQVADKADRQSMGVYAIFTSSTREPSFFFVAGVMSRLGGTLALGLRGRVWFRGRGKARTARSILPILGPGINCLAANGRNECQRGVREEGMALTPSRCYVMWGLGETCTNANAYFYVDIIDNIRKPATYFFGFV